jgi:hypothetical protein
MTIRHVPNCIIAVFAGTKSGGPKIEASSAPELRAEIIAEFALAVLR